MRRELTTEGVKGFLRAGKHRVLAIQGAREFPEPFYISAVVYQNSQNSKRNENMSTDRFVYQCSHKCY